MKQERLAPFRKNEQLEKLLNEINGLLGPVEQKIMVQYSEPRFPVLLIIGGPRSGSTFFLQWIAATGAFAYPTNLLSRFYGAPYIGAKIQLMLADPRYDFRQELFEFQPRIDFQSELGKTKGALAPNDFWFFWRRFFPVVQPAYLPEDKIIHSDIRGFIAELAAVESVFQKPFAMKGTILQHNIDFLAQASSKFFFLYLKRHPFFNIQSLLLAREKFYGHRFKWYAFRPKEYSFLKEMDPVYQVAGQVYFKNQKIEALLKQLPESRYLEVSYEEFCAYPEKTYSDLVEKYKNLGYVLPPRYQGPLSFESSNIIRVSPKEVDSIIDAYKYFSGQSISLVKESA